MKNVLLVVAGVIIGVLVFMIYADRKASDGMNKNLAGLEVNFDRSYHATELKVAEVEMAEREQVRTKWDSEKVYPYYQKMLEVRKYSVELVKYVDHIRDTLKIDNANRFMIEAGMARQLKQKMDETLERMISELSWSDTQSVRRVILDSNYFVNFGGDSNWEREHFGTGVPVALARANLAGIKNDLANIEQIIVNEIYRESRRIECFGRSEFVSLTVPHTSMALVGDRWDVSVLCFPTLDPEKEKVTEINVNGKNVKVVNNMGTYSEDLSKEGLRTVSGIVKLQSNRGLVQQQVRAECMVFKPRTIVTNDNMRYLVAGKPNPISVCVSYAPSDWTFLSVSRGEVAGKNGKYTVTVNEPGPVTLRTSVKFQTGKVRVVDSVVYMVRNLDLKD
jgi:hypothetical protein